MSNSTVNLKDLCPEKEGLKRGMNSRHLMMISIGGTIGTGLFLGSGVTLNQAGPLGAVLAYLTGGFIMYLVLLCLGELTSAMPVSGSFQSYASRFISPGAGFTTGWLYWLNWAICIAADFTAAGIIMHNWFPQIEIWIWCGFFAIMLALLNIISVRAYGEAEFWFASIKVTAILAFIVAGAGLLFGFSSHSVPIVGLSNFNTEAGLFPNGFQAVFLTMIAVVYSFQGAELVGIAAGECQDASKNVPRVIKGITFRIIFFYVLAMIVLAGIIPWQEASVLESPFAHVFGILGFPLAKDIMSFVVMTSALSAGNSALYACSRLLWSMSKEGLAPKCLSTLNSRGVPVNGVYITVILACMSLLTSEYAADTVYLWLMSSTGLTGCLIWVIIAWCQLNFRREFFRLGGKIEQLKFRTPFYPLVPILALTLNLGVICSLYFDESQRIVLYTGIPALLGVYLYYILFLDKKISAAKIEQKMN
ncbi:amino acid permease [Pelosinus propionicus]|uniref:Arginine:proton symporter, AAT family n=1 Tax=Pelosinus propionicus DSM 13327 TaxID=1123291 RepID=A0A1I4GNC2_9FIRM|nr:amino acid permease [Pelosinus propionicus]SFL30993.1 arginine:proton symporter, AAT family [Pelosinus propionicus DSM 13327]